MIVSEAYRTDRTMSLCRDHYDGRKPAPADAAPPGQVQDARDDVPCEWCEAAVVAHGYSFTEWLAAAGRSDSASEYDLRAAWRAGERPEDYAV